MDDRGLGTDRDGPLVGGVATRPTSMPAPPAPPGPPGPPLTAFSFGKTRCGLSILWYNVGGIKSESAVMAFCAGVWDPGACCSCLSAD